MPYLSTAVKSPVHETSNDISKDPGAVLKSQPTKQHCKCSALCAANEDMSSGEAAGALGEMTLDQSEEPVEVLSLAGKDTSEIVQTRRSEPLHVDTMINRLTLAPCPTRLRPLVPPLNFGAVETGLIYRSAFPNDDNIDFLYSLHIKTSLVLVDTAPTPAYTTYIATSGISLFRTNIAPNKGDRIETTLESLCEAILFLVDPKNYPLHIHCNQGRHRTGCVIACLRKCQGISVSEAQAEYTTYANPKVRAGDLQLIENFDPQDFVNYAKTRGVTFSDRVDSATSTRETSPFGSSPIMPPTPPSDDALADMSQLMMMDDTV